MFLKVKNWVPIKNLWLLVLHSPIKKKTLTDEETDGMMNRIINSIEKNVAAEIRRSS